MDVVLVTVFDNDSNRWYECGDTGIPSDMDDDTACLVAKGLVYESNWSPGSVTLCIAREDAGGLRVLYEGL
jgi:hypothetical protein